MNETVILVALIVGFFAITIFALVALLAVRKREQATHDNRGLDDAVARMDAALDSALVEINRIGTLIKSEIDEKYQAMLFLYDMVDKKKEEIAKEIQEIESAAEMDTAVLANYLENHISELKQTNAYVSDNFDDAVADSVDITPKPRQNITNPKHAQIWDMHADGKTVHEIAKAMNIGTGEIELILNLYKR